MARTIGEALDTILAFCVSAAAVLATLAALLFTCWFIMGPVSAAAVIVAAVALLFAYWIVNQPMGPRF